jgi:hypothetical protein
MKSLWSVLIGARQARRGGRFSRTDDRLLQTITAKYFPAGYTILEARGGWFDAATRRFIREDSRQILVTSDGMRTVRAWANALRIALNQKELLLIQMGSPRIIRARARST